MWDATMFINTPYFQQLEVAQRSPGVSHQYLCNRDGDAEVQGCRWILLTGTHCESQLGLSTGVE